MLDLSGETALPGEPVEYRMTATVRAVRVDEPFQVDTPGGTQRGEAGDYLAVGVTGERYRIAASYLDALYAPVE